MKDTANMFNSTEENYMFYMVSHAFSSIPHLHKEISIIYEKRELEYYRAYRLLDVDIEQRFSHYPFEQVTAMIQSLGILHLAALEKSFDIVCPIVRKGFGPVWKYTKLHGVFSLNALKDDIAKRNNGILEIDQIANYLSVGVFLSYYKEELEGFNSWEEIDDTIKIYLSDLLATFIYKPENRASFFTDTHEKLGKTLLQPDLDQHLRLFRRSSNTHDFMSSIIHSEVDKLESMNEQELDKLSLSLSTLQDMPNTQSTLEQIMNIGIDLVEKMKQLNDTDLVDTISQQGWSRYLISLRGLLTLHQFDPNTFGKLNRYDKGMDVKLHQLLGFLRKDFHFTEDELKLTTVFHYYLTIIEEEYTKLRQLASNGSKEQILTSLQTLEERQIELETEKQTLNVQHMTETKALQLQLDRALQENKELTTSLRKLEKQHQESLRHSLEVVALRRYITFHIESQESQESPVTIEQMLNELQNKNIAFVGGHLNWQRKMKEVLPMAKFIYVDDINRNFNVLHSVDIVFLNSTVLNHGFYYKFLNVMESAAVPFYYLSNAVNRDRSIQEIYEYIKT